MGLNLPSSLFPSEIEDKVGVLNRAAVTKGPRPDLDPDIVAALDSDNSDVEFSDGALDDDFVIKANDGATSSDDDYAHGFDAGMSSSNGFFDHELREKDDNFSAEDTKSRFTNYSLSSSVLYRNHGLTLLDEKFEEMFAEYDDEKIGSLDEVSVEGSINSRDPKLRDVMDEFHESRQEEKFSAVRGNLQRVERRKCLKAVQEEKEDLTKIEFEEPTEKWDCESILSTYSSLYNHPKIISEPHKVKPIKVSAKTGIPVNVLNSGVLTTANLKSFDESMGFAKSTRSEISAVTSIRSRGETTEERRARKQKVKEYRKARRVEKKANKEAFKEEKKKQEKVLLNLQQNLKGIKLI